MYNTYCQTTRAYQPASTCEIPLNDDHKLGCVSPPPSFFKLWFCQSKTWTPGSSPKTVQSNCPPLRFRRDVPTTLLVWITLRVRRGVTTTTLGFPGVPWQEHTYTPIGLPVCSHRYILTQNPNTSPFSWTLFITQNVHPYTPYPLIRFQTTHSPNPVFHNKNAPKWQKIRLVSGGHGQADSLAAHDLGGLALY